MNYNELKDKIVTIAKECDIQGLIDLANKLDPTCNAVNPFNNRPVKTYFCFSERCFAIHVGYDLYDGVAGYFEKYSEGDLSGEYFLACMGLGVIPFKKEGYPEEKYSDTLDDLSAYIQDRKMSPKDAVNYLYNSEIAHLIDFESKPWIAERIEGFTGNKEEVDHG